MDTVSIRDAFRETLEMAKRFEAESGKPHYIIVLDRDYRVIAQQPYVGPWWTSDGIRHGS